MKSKNKKTDSFVTENRMNPVKNLVISAVNFMPKENEVQNILRKRAEVIAKQSTTDSADNNSVIYIRFRLGEKEKYGVSYQFLNEVMHNIIVTKVPNVPNFIAGVVNYRGALISVIDLGRFFNIPSEIADNQEGNIVIVTNNDITVGILVDKIEGSDLYNPVELGAALRFSGAIKPEYIIGLHRGATAIIDMNQVITDCKLQLQK